jgi:hypothetical protein
MSGGSDPAEPADMSAAQRAPHDREQAALARVGACAAQAPWVSLTKGECLMLALALHRLARANAPSTSPDPECQP